VAVAESSWKKNIPVVVALLLIFGLALFLRVYFVYGLAMPDRLVSGGSDSFYYHRILEHAFLTGEQLTDDCLLNYPMCLTNPRPPLFAWWSLLSGYAISPLFGTPWDAITYSFILSTAIFGALTIFPTYALVKEAFNRRAGLVAAFLLAVSPAHLQRSMASNADHDAFVLFFVVTGFFFFLRALQSLNEKRWVASWARPAAIRAGLALFFRENRAAVLYSLLAAMAMATVALTWQGWAYAPVILLVYFVFQIFVHRIRNQDPLGITIAFAITIGVALLVAAPWYVLLNQVKVWFDVPAYLFGAALLLGIVFTVTRDYPWALVIPTTMGVASIALGVGVVVNPSLANAFVSGAGYFVQTKLYATIAEAQAPVLSQVILAFGWGTYFLSWAGVGYLLWQIVTGRRMQTAYLFFVIWSVAAIIMAQAAGRFIFNASPAFAATAGFAISLIIGRLDFDGLKRTYGSLSAGGRIAAIRKTVKPRHVIAVLGLAVLLFLPNIWYGVDAAIPIESKLPYDRSIYEYTPGPLRPPNYEAFAAAGRPFYLGAFGFNLPQPDEYFPAAWRWLSGEDAGLLPVERPAFLSWWDYGFEAVDAGKHPTVADNFQDGYHLAGNVISAQSENEAIALLTVRLVEGDFYAHGRSFGPSVRAALTGFGIDVASLEGTYRDPASRTPAIRGDPERYGYYDDQMQAQNALYIYAGDLLTSALNTDEQADLYHAIRGATGKSIRYFAVDARLFPTSAENTGIFYAPIVLSDHRVIELPDGRVLPPDFFRIYVRVGGQLVPIEDVGEFEQPEGGGQIAYQAMFYRSFFYRVYIGFRPTEAGASQDDGIPGISGQTAAAMQPLPGWGLSHWRIAYQTAYYNPYTDTQNHSTEWRAMNYFDALRLKEEIDAGRVVGTVDLSAAAVVGNGIVFAKYYDGAYVNGTIAVEGKIPVQGLRVTVHDELGVPHDEAITDADGRFSVLVPFGEAKVIVTSGSVDLRTRVGANEIETLTLTVSDAAAMRENVDSDGDGTLDWLITRNVALPGSTVSGRVFLDVNENGVFDDGVDELLPATTVVYENAQLGTRSTTVTDPAGRYVIPNVPEGTARVNVTAEGRTIALGDQEVPPQDAERDLVVPALRVSGRAEDANGNGVPGATILVRDETNGTTMRFAADPSGEYIARGLIRGPYEVHATSGDLLSLPEKTNLSAGISASGVDLTLFPSGNVTGTTVVGGNVQPFATVSLTLLSDRSVTRSATSDASGRYTVRLPAGEWAVTGRHYRDGRLFAILGTVDVVRGQNSTFPAAFVDAVEVQGRVFIGTLTNVSRGTQVAFRSADGSLYLTVTSVGGQYLAYLPRGTYDVQAVAEGFAFLERRTFQTSTVLNLGLVPRTAYTGTAYRDLDRDGTADPGEGLSGIRISITDPQGRVLTVFSEITGGFGAPLDPDTVYRASVEASGFETILRGPARPENLGLAGDVPLVALNVTLSGTLLMAGAPVAGASIEIQLLAKGGGALKAETVADANGRYAISFAPGEYELLVDENVTSGSDAVRWQNAAVDRITTEVAASAVFDLHVVQRARVRGNVTLDAQAVGASVTFEGPDRIVESVTSGSFQTYVALGNYSVLASTTRDGDTYLFLSSLALGGAVDLAISLQRATAVTGLLTVAGQAVPAGVVVTWLRSQGGVVRATTDAAGRYRAELAAGDYTASVDHRTTMPVGGVPRYVRLTFSGPLTVAPNATSATLDISTKANLDNATVSGRVTHGGLGRAATLVFTQRTPSGINMTTVAAADGGFSVGLQPGTYDLYVLAAAGDLAFLGPVTIAPGQDTQVSPVLIPSYAVGGVTSFRSSVRVSADVTFSAGATARTRSDAAGLYRILLPPGSYSVTAVTTVPERGIAVRYSALTTLEVTAMTDPLNLNLARVDVRRVTIAWDSAERATIPPGGAVTYTLVLRNTGNVGDTFRLSGSPSGWIFRFSQPRLFLDFGGVAGTSATVIATILTSRDALVEHEDVRIRATSETDDSQAGETTVFVDIRRQRGLVLDLSVVRPTFDGHRLNYTTTVRNTGNAAERVSLTLPNAGELAARGWIARFAPPDGGTLALTLRNLTVEANSTRTVTVVFENTGGGGGASAVVRVSAEDLVTLQATREFPLELPILSGTGRVTATGVSVVSDLPLNYPLLAILITVVASVAAGFVLTLRRRR